ncbi:LysE family translocator [Ensifer sp.]|jgi:threonine/homoserine/homoserine lactone efflux protein|uniref:LysE family translocator n=1 Tax=Ensifer sp. TaxID=1872086 RepID=UPI002E0E2689|nr:LysE family translocator [Ensifer sp.]
MELGTLAGFAVVTFVAVVTPGPDVILAMANGSRFGMKKAIAGMVGVLISDFFLILAVAAGLGALLAASEFWFSVVKYAGAAYLAWLGYKMLKPGRRDTMQTLGDASPVRQETALSICRHSMIVAITNPKAYLFFSALLPQFINPAEAQVPQFLALTVVFSVVEFAVMFGYALVGFKTTQFAASSMRRWMEKGCGGALLLSAASLAMVKRAN